MKKLMIIFSRDYGLILRYYSNSDMKIIGGEDLFYTHEIEIIFRDVFFVSLPMEWKTNTKKTVFELLEGENAKKINILYKVEQGYYILKFAPEDYQKEFGCLIAAKTIEYTLIK
ncbi:hypothetical protein [Anaeromicropila herbilytica]|uniref:Uncharacterized protein n=1 Tax=Anaeromicropila herbilytica TaxID=2785025 RepID=A0A7R7EIL1_9FIRM|nr:hypothetical protein [Anaeromicropila herbilytica]BCN29443.1 hypothetical protein bsdtb5_07380 [Anaeromicropila herbilytica]